MKWRLILAAALLVVGASGVDAAEHVRPTIDVTDVRVEVTWVESRDEMAAIVRKYASPTFARKYGRHHEGFSVLGKRGGELVCLIFVEKPRRVGDRHMDALGHELMHCLAGDFHR